MITKRFSVLFNIFLITAILLAGLLVSVGSVSAAAPGKTMANYGPHDQSGPLPDQLYMAYQNKVLDHIAGTSHNEANLQKPVITSVSTSFSFEQLLGKLYQKLGTYRTSTYLINGHMTQRIGR